jgi:hypothetical protein
MSGNVLDVFDEWGNYVGKFTPSDGGLDGCFMIIALIIVGIIGFAIYAVVKILIKVVIKGFEALGQKKWGEAIACLSPIWLSVILALVLIAAGGASVVNQQNQQKQQNAQATQTEQAWQVQNVVEPTETAQSEIQALKTLLTFNNVQKITCDQAPWNLGSKPLWEKNGMTCDGLNLKFTLVNKSQYTINLARSWCWSQQQVDTGVLPYMDYYTSDFEVLPTSELTLYCSPSSFGSETLLVWIGDNYFGSPGGGSVSGIADLLTGEITIK